MNIRETPPQSPTQDRSIESLVVLKAEKMLLLRFAIQLCESAHAGQERRDGTPYAEHPKAVARILIEECGIHNFDVIVSALLHDTLEDGRIFGSVKDIPFQEWKKHAGTLLSRIFGNTVAKMVLSLSKPYADNKRPTVKERRRYYTGLNDSIRERPMTILIKMADRLHNLRTPNDMPEEKWLRKLRETRDTYFPIFEKMITAEQETITSLKSSIIQWRREQETLSKEDAAITAQSIHKARQRIRSAETTIQAGVYLLESIKEIVYAEFDKRSLAE